jgi:uncharacterized protein
MRYLLFYEVADDYVFRRPQFRDAHLEKAWQASERGELVLGGALSNPIDGAVLLFKGDSPEIAEKFARADPYATSGSREAMACAGMEDGCGRRLLYTHPAKCSRRHSNHRERVFER